MTETIRTALLEYSRASVARGLTGGTSGNISQRHGTGMMVTPSGIAPERMTSGQMVEMAFDGTHDSPCAPTSEWALHAAIYQSRPEVGAIVHAHPRHCTALSTLRRPIPAFHYLVGGLGGFEVPCASYATFGTPEMAQAVITAIAPGFHGCLMANHGMVAFGRDLPQAFGRALLMETLAEQYLLALSSGLAPVLLSPEEMADVAAQAARLNYGSQG